MVKEGYFPKATMGDETHLRKEFYSTNEVMQRHPKGPSFFPLGNKVGGVGIFQIVMFPMCSIHLCLIDSQHVPKFQMCCSLCSR
jgi:hypothetical protein